MEERTLVLKKHIDDVDADVHHHWTRFSVSVGFSLVHVICGSCVDSVFVHA